jgi:hypothetical protein
MAKHHFTVHVEVKEVTPAQSEVRPGGINKPQPATERAVDEVVSVTTRADDKRMAIEKAVRMLEAEGEDENDDE